MGKSGESSAAAGRRRSLPSLLRDYGNAIEAVCPPFDAIAGAARLHDEAQARGLLQPGPPLASDLVAMGTALEEQAPPFDVEAGAARLRETAIARDLLSGMGSGISEEATPEPRKQGQGIPQRMVAQASGQGQLLNSRYRLVRVLGEGGMGSAWLADDLLLGRRVTLKVPRRGIVSTEMDARRFLQEASALAGVRHPAVASVLDVFFDHEDLWVVMEYIKGRTLSDIIARDSPLEERAVAAIGLQVASGLAAVHKAGVVHRDIKPENILVTSDNSVVLVDFGITNRPEGRPLTRPGGAVTGMPEFLAPERFAPSHHDGAAADLWSLGVTLYSALEGRSPFKRADWNATMRAIMYEAPPKPARRGRLAEVVLRLLDKAPARRPSVNELMATLAPLLVEPGERHPIPRPNPRPPATALQPAQPGETPLTDHKVQDYQETIHDIGTDAAATLLLSMPEAHAAQVLSGCSAREAAGFITAVAAIRPAAATSILLNLPVTNAGLVLPLLGASSGAPILDLMPLDRALMIIDTVDTVSVGRMLAGLPGPVAAKMVGAMPTPRATEILARMSPRTAAAVIANIDSENTRARLLRQLDPSLREQIQRQNSN